MGLKPELIRTTQYHKDLREGFLKDNRLLNTASRVSVFDLIDYDKMVFVDTDILLRTNVDELFNYPDGSMCSPVPEDGGFEGLLVFIPKNHHFGIYPFLIENLPMMTAELFSELWFPIKSNPDYAIPMTYFYDFSALKQINDDNLDVKIIHFAQNKPWLIKTSNELYNTPECQEYLSIYNKVKEKVCKVYRELL